MIPALRFCTLLLLASALASCGDTDKDGAKQASSANSVILKGTISDDMIPYDTLRSQPPPAKIIPKEAAPAGAGTSQPPADGDVAEPDAQETGGAASAATNAPEQSGTATPAATAHNE